MSRSPIRSAQQQQPQNPWHAATKRHILRAWNTNDSKDEDVHKELHAKFQQILDNLRADCEDFKLEQEEALKIGLVKLPKSIRQMSIQEFNQAHQCNVLALLKAKLNEEAATLSSFKGNNSNNNNTKKREHYQTVAATPAPTRSRAVAPGSAVRTVRKGEGIFSVNGSPVETHEVGSVVATVTKKRRNGSEATAANFEINVGEGRVINLNDPTGVNQLDSDMKATAASQLKVLQDQMASLMAQLTK